jgi:hypothetical protein
MKFALASALVIAAAIVDIVLSMKWTESYFRIGLPLFRRRIARPEGLVGVSLDELARSGATASGPQLVFRQLAPDLIAFREKSIGGYVPILRGVIRYKQEEGVVVMTGLLNWFAVALIQGSRVYRAANALRAPRIVSAAATPTSP